MQEENLLTALKSNKSFTCNGLLEVLLSADVGSLAVSDWRKRLGGRLIVERVQKKTWNLAEAAREAKIDAGTVRRIEAGGNYEVTKLERYAEALGRPLEAWLREVLAVPEDVLKHIEEWSRLEPPQDAQGEASAPTKKRRQVG